MKMLILISYQLSTAVGRAQSAIEAGIRREIRERFADLIVRDFA